MLHQKPLTKVRGSFCFYCQRESAYRYRTRTARPRRRVWDRHTIQTSNFPHQRGKILASIAVAPQGFLDYTVDLYPVLYFPVQPSQRRHPYELSVSIFAYSGVLFSGRDLHAVLPLPLRPASTACYCFCRAPLRHREARAGQGSGPVPHRHLPAAVCACRRGRHGAVAEMGEMLLPIVIAIIR